MPGHTLYRRGRAHQCFIINGSGPASYSLMLFVVDRGEFLSVRTQPLRLPSAAMNASDWQSTLPLSSGAEPCVPIGDWFYHWSPRAVQSNKLFEP